MVWSLKQFHPYLYGSQFTIYTDHAALRSILGAKLSRGRLARWIMALQGYQSYNIAHKKGVLNTNADDALSRIEQVNAQYFNIWDLQTCETRGIGRTTPPLFDPLLIIRSTLR